MVTPCALDRPPVLQICTPRLEVGISASKCKPVPEESPEAINYSMPLIWMSAKTSIPARWSLPKHAGSQLAQDEA